MQGFMQRDHILLNRYSVNSVLGELETLEMSAPNFSQWEASH